MSTSLIVSGVGAIVAAIGLGVVMARCFRAPRGDLAAWSVALLGLVVGLGAQALGHLMGFSPVTFRAMEIGAQLIAPLALLIGLCEVVGKQLPARFAARLFIPALGFVSLVILSTDPLSGTAFTKAWPDPVVYYQLIPNKLIEYGLSLVSLVVAVVAVSIAAYRSRRERAWRGVFPAVGAAGLAVLALVIPGIEPVLSSRLGVSLPLSTLFAVFCLLAAVLTWYAGVGTERVSLAALRDGVAPVPDRAYDRDDDPADTGGWGAAAPQPDHDYEAYDDGGQGVYRGSGLYRDEPPGSGPGRGVPDDTGYGWQGEADGYPADGYPADAYPADGQGADYDSRQFDPAYGPAGYDLEPGYGGRAAAGPAGLGPKAGRPDRDAGRAELFGQIAIYTLIEDRVPEFDRLTERVVAQVREREPDTLVFIVHAVPSAPMQRILYEVYRDRAAFDWHEEQRYVAQFEADRQPYVLATNVIELGLQQAKVSPFPSIVDLFGEPGYDTSGFERPDYTRDYGTSAGQSGAGQNGAPQNGAGQNGAGQNGASRGGQGRNGTLR